MRGTRPYTYLGTVQGMCRECRRQVPARVFEDNGAVYQERLCPACGPARARLADDVAWYLDRTATMVHCKPARLPGCPVRAGCPGDCGPCAAHANACHLPVFSVTNVCDLNCPICFTYNRADRRYFMSRSELRSLLDKLLERAGPVDLVNITGGEPTLHPDILELLRECVRPDIGRVTMNSNGRRIANDEAFCQALAEMGVYVVLSFDTLQPSRSMVIHGRDVVEQKLQALENLERFGIGTTLLNVMIRGVNDDEIGEIVRLAKTHSVVRSITVQTMTFTGKGGGNFQPRQTMPLDGAAAALERGTAGEMRSRDFFAHPSAHPLCYSVAYYLKDAEKYRSLREFLGVDELKRMLAGGYLLQPGADGQELFRHSLDRLWAEGDPHNLLPAVRRLVERMYPTERSLSEAERQAAAERSILAVYLHSHMDEDTLDLARLAVCPDQVPDPEGRLIPACAYNLFYRHKDPRFWQAEPAPACGSGKEVWTA
jgi:7,8-dihydro-6-hydroxymethylpterin dimethyltransferase